MHLRGMLIVASLLLATGLMTSWRVGADVTVLQNMVASSSSTAGHAGVSPRILVTGAAGFIGFHLVTWCAKHDVPVVGLDAFRDQLDLRRRREEQLLRVGARIVHGDVCNETVVKELLREHRINTVVHLAAGAAVGAGAARVYPRQHRVHHGAV
jgi:hypothetical protein